MGFFDTFLNTVPAEDRAILDKYPQLQQATAQMEEENAKLLAYGIRWNNWQKENWDPNAEMTKSEIALRAELGQAKARLDAGVAAGAKPSDILALRTEFEAKLANAQKENAANVEGMHYFYRTAALKTQSHRDEFGEKFDPNKLMEFMSNNKIQDADVAYDRMVADKRAANATEAAAKAAEENRLQLEAAEKRGYDKRATEAAMGPNGQMPTDSTGGIIGMPSMMSGASKVSDDEAKFISEAKLGDNKLAMLGYQKFLKGDYATQ